MQLQAPSASAPNYTSIGGDITYALVRGYVIIAAIMNANLIKVINIVILFYSHLLIIFCLSRFSSSIQPTGPIRERRNPSTSALFYPLTKFFPKMTKFKFSTLFLRIPENYGLTAGAPLAKMTPFQVQQQF